MLLEGNHGGLSETEAAGIDQVVAAGTGRATRTCDRERASLRGARRRVPSRWAHSRAFYTCNLETNTHTAFHDNDSHDIEPTDVQTALIHDCVPGAEVYMNDAGYGTDDPTGWYECHRLVNNICENGHIHINISYANIPEDVNRTLALICEEVGHSVGLDHRFGEATTCMSEFIDARHLDAHDKAVLNTNF
jgi:hypothetical protein